MNECFISDINNFKTALTVMKKSVSKVISYYYIGASIAKTKKKAKYNSD